MRGFGAGRGESNGIVVRGRVVAATGTSVRCTYRGISALCARRCKEVEGPRRKTAWDVARSRGQSSRRGTGVSEAGRRVGIAVWIWRRGREKQRRRRKRVVTMEAGGVGGDEGEAGEEEEDGDDEGE